MNKLFAALAVLALASPVMAKETYITSALDWYTKPQVRIAEPVFMWVDKEGAVTLGVMSQCPEECKPKPMSNLLELRAPICTETSK